MLSPASVSCSVNLEPEEKCADVLLMLAALQPYGQSWTAADHLPTARVREFCLRMEQDEQCGLPPHGGTPSPPLPGRHQRGCRTVSNTVPSPCTPVAQDVLRLLGGCQRKDEVFDNSSAHH